MATRDESKKNGYKWVIRHFLDKGIAASILIPFKVWAYPRYYRWLRYRSAIDNSRNFLERKGLTQYYKSLRLPENDHSTILPYYSRGNNRKYLQNYFIYHMVRRRKPHTVIEFGSGWSTITIAAALEANYEENPECYQAGRPVVHIIEAGKNWLEHVQKMFPKSLIKFCNFCLSTPHTQTLNGELCICHDELPDVGPDMIYVDGPALHDIVGKVAGLSISRQAVADVKLYENKMSSDCTIMIDSRLGQLTFLLRNLVGYYRCTYLPLAEQSVLQKCTTPSPLRIQGGKSLFDNLVFSRYLRNESRSQKIITVKGNYSLLP